jgi:hypothetical protein
MFSHMSHHHSSIIYIVHEFVEYGDNAECSWIGNRSAYLTHQNFVTMTNEITKRVFNESNALWIIHQHLCTNNYHSVRINAKYTWFEGKIRSYK